MFNSPFRLQWAEFNWMPIYSLLMGKFPENMGDGYEACKCVVTEWYSWGMNMRHVSVL